MRIVEGSGAGVGGFRSDAGAFNGGDDTTPWAEADGAFISQEQGGGGMHDDAVVWCQPCTEGRLEGAASAGLAAAGLGATTWASGFAFSSQCFIGSPNGCESEGEGEVDPADEVEVVDDGES